MDCPGQVVDLPHWSILARKQQVTAMHELTQEFRKFTEWYEVVQTVSVRLEERLFRIEVIRRFDRRLQSAYDALLWTTAAANEALEPYEYLVRDTSFPWVAQDTPEGALQAALAHLQDRLGKT